MKKFISFVLIMILALTLIGCGAEANDDLDSLGNQQGGDMSGDQTELPDGAIRYVALVTDIVGNYLTVQLGEMQGGMSGGMPEGSFEGGERPEGTEMPEGGFEGGEMPEGFERGEGGERPEGTEMPEGDFEGGEMPEGGMRGESGEFGGMSLEGTDYSELIELTDEIMEFNIAVGVPVNMYGSEMSFSQITEGMYLTITTDESGTVLSVDLLG